MSKEVVIPQVGEGVDAIDVVKVLVKAGDTIEVDQPILEIETGKATVEVPSTDAGKVSEILVQEGAQVKPGQPILRLEANAEAEADAQGQNDQEGQEGQDQDGPQEDTSADAPDSQAEAISSSTGSKPEPRSDARKGTSVPAAPSVRRLARELGVDLNVVSGSGPHGRVSRADVERLAREGSGPPAPAAGSPSLPDFSRWGSVSTEKMSAIRRKTAQHLALSWSTIPHVTVHDKADISELEPLRKRYAGRAEKEGGKLTMAVMVTKIVASALKRFPKMNASVDMGNESIIFKKYCHVGIAVATERGLVVPVIKDADKKNMVELAAEISLIAERARAGKLSTEDMQGGTFTVTNMGRIGGSYFTPIINYPEVGILGMGRYFQESDPSGGAPRTYLPLSLSFDHRLVDGADGAEFLGWIIDALREPMLLSLEG